MFLFVSHSLQRSDGEQQKENPRSGSGRPSFSLSFTGSESLHVVLTAITQRYEGAGRDATHGNQDRNTDRGRHKEMAKGVVAGEAGDAGPVDTAVLRTVDERHKH